MARAPYISATTIGLIARRRASAAAGVAVAAVGSVTTPFTLTKTR